MSETKEKRGHQSNLYGSVIFPMITTARQFVRSLKRPSTVVYPFEKLEDKASFKGARFFGVDALGEGATIWDNYRGQHSLNVEDCISCGVCERSCPDKAIEMVIDHAISDVNRHPQVDYGRCCFCSLCVDSCPQQCLEMTPVYEIVSYERNGLVTSPAILYENYKKYKHIKKLAIEKPVDNISVNLVPSLCTGCSICEKKCPEHAIKMIDINAKNSKIRRIWKEPVIDNNICVRCGECIESCSKGALLWKEG